MSDNFTYYMLLPGLILSGIGLILMRTGWRLEDMEKGALSENLIGHAIEAALTNEGCAVAHDVIAFGAGDIDHLVATPKGLWVIESKTCAIPNDEFPLTLQNLAWKVRDVRTWAGDVPVRGCLVFNEDPEKRKEVYETEGETLRCYWDRKALYKALRSDVAEACGSKELADRVWKLSVTADQMGDNNIDQNDESTERESPIKQQLTT